MISYRVTTFLSYHRSHDYESTVQYSTVQNTVLFYVFVTKGMGARTECSYSCSSCAMPSIKRSLASCAVVLLLPRAAYSFPTLLVAARSAFKFPKMVY